MKRRFVLPSARHTLEKAKSFTGEAKLRADVKGESFSMMNKVFAFDKVLRVGFALKKIRGINKRDKEISFPWEIILLGHFSFM